MCLVGEPGNLGAPSGPPCSGPAHDLISANPNFLLKPLSPDARDSPGALLPWPHLTPSRAWDMPTYPVLTTQAGERETQGSIYWPLQWSWPRTSLGRDTVQYWWSTGVWQKAWAISLHRAPSEGPQYHWRQHDDPAQGCPFIPTFLWEESVEGMR
jgi:hypothetical protein